MLLLYHSNGPLSPSGHPAPRLPTSTRLDPMLCSRSYSGQGKPLSIKCCSDNKLLQMLASGDSSEADPLF